MLEVRAIPESRAPKLFEWYEQYRAGSIDMDPSYQRRGNLWEPWRKKLLINSILNGYDIPKIYLADFTYGPTPLMESKKPYAVVDGKQRLETFFEFFQDKWPLDAKPVYLPDQELHLDGLHLSDLRKLHPELASRFEQYVPAVMSVISDQLEEIQELFVRLNTNLSISGAEKRNAMPGPLPQLIKELSVHKFFRTRVSFPVERGQDLNTAAKILRLENEGGFASLHPRSLDGFVNRNVKEPKEKFKGIYQQASKTLSQMVKIFHERDVLLRRQTLIPLFYWLVRQHGHRHANLIRPFLQQFEEDRAEVRSQLAARGRGKQVEVSDQDLVGFNNRLRSPDGRRNLEAMFAELERRFSNYVEAHAINGGRSR